MYVCIHGMVEVGTGYSPAGVAPSRMVSVSASVNLPLHLHHKVQKFSSGIGSPGWSWKKGRKKMWYVRIFCMTVYCMHV